MILQLVIVEGLLIGLLSWLIGILMSFPITLILNQVVETHC
jgi:ABC-type lipoprotein release transport system permease subunit